MNETNQINNTSLKEDICNRVVQVLLNNKLITEEELKGVSVSFGYIFTKPNGVLEGLFKASSSDKTFYFALQNGSLSLININDTMFNDTVSHMKEFHPCLNEEPTDTSDKNKQRRIKNNEYLKQNNIATNDNLLCDKDETSIKLKSIDDMCKRAIASLITIQVACDINNGQDIKSEEYKENFDLVKSLYKKFGVEDSLNPKEKRIIDATYSEQDVYDMDWEYETYWALCWCLGLVDDIKDGSSLCDCGQAIDFVVKSSSFDDFKSKCKIRSIEEILDMYDLYLRYNWAINNKYVDPNTATGNLNASNVIERRRALEWVISDVNDWYDLQLNA